MYAKMRNYMGGAKLALLLMAVALVSGLAWAQGEGGMDCPCEQTIALSDNTCSSPWDDCTTPSGDYQSTTFIASCTGHYTITVSISCTSGSCSDYNVCAQLYESGTLLGHCYDPGNCTQCYASCQTLCLYSGHEYKLYVSLESCGDSQCPPTVTCTAYGTVKYCGPLNITCQ